MKVLVTGAAGFIGSHLAERLAARGDTVVGVDNFNDYYSPARKRRNARAVRDAGVQVVEADIRNRDTMFALFKEHAFDAVAHIAAMAGVRNAVANPALYMDVNLVGTQHLMDASLEFGVHTFVMASTSSVYGDAPAHIPFHESDPCLEPPQPYAAAKRAAELLGFTYHKLYGLNFTATRFFTVYGPRGRPDMMPGLLAESIYYGNTIPLYEGDMRRDWTYVGDIVSGVVLALDTPLGYEIINIGRGAPEPLAAFITTIEEVAGQRARLEPKPKLPADMLVTYADISKAQTLLGFNPTVSIREGVEAFWVWFEAEQKELASA